MELTAQQCEAHLRAGGVGRVVFVSSRGPAAHPLNFAVSKGDVIVSTTVDHARRLEDQPQVSFIIDRVDASTRRRVDESMGEGGSVLVTGPARRVDDPDEAVALAVLSLEPWAGGPRHALVRIHPEEVTGRLIAQAVAPG
jgi:nitroimidazol reductase NimA-like FMN-containing flavoprotein (pyridoxamine 5'-phosphate oxidase superfamily)